MILFSFLQVKSNSTKDNLVKHVLESPLWTEIHNHNQSPIERWLPTISLHFTSLKWCMITGLFREVLKNTQSIVSVITNHFFLAITWTGCSQLLLVLPVTRNMPSASRECSLDSCAKIIYSSSGLSVVGTIGAKNLTTYWQNCGKFDREEWVK